MKYSILTLVLLFISMTSFSQEQKFVYDINGLNPKYIVVDCDSITQNELFKKSIIWIKENFKNPDKVIKTTIEFEKIRFEGFTENAICFGSEGTSNCQGLTYMIEVSFKDGKYKFEPINLSYYVSTYGTVEVSLEKGVYYKKNGELRNIYKQIPTQIENLFNDLNNSLKNYLLDKIKTEEW